MWNHLKYLLSIILTLKESGKLIVILTAADICDMLSLKDQGKEPANILRDKIDEMLIALTR